MSLLSSSFILSGPKLTITEGSFAKLLWNALNDANPNSTFVDSDNNQSFTYGEILKRTTDLVQEFAQLGVDKSDNIVVISENNLETIIVLTAALFAGITASPINPNYKTDELSNVLKTVKPKIIFCSSSTFNNILQYKEKLSFIETVRLITKNKDHESLQNDKTNFANPSLSDGRILLFSSGTTGLPKGVIINGSSLKIAVTAFTGPSGIDANTKGAILHPLPCYHIYAINAVFMSVISQRTLVFINKFKPELFLQTIEKYKITQTFIVPPILQFLRNSSLVREYDISSLKDIVVAGSAIGKEEQLDAIKRLGAEVRIAYGMTESSGLLTSLPRSSLKPGSIGKLIHGALAKVWDSSTRQNLGPLQVGEMCFKGPTIMQGYVDNEAATKQSFDEDGFYHSGDLGYYDEEEYIHYCGRIKEMIKYNGYQVSPIELETLLMTHPMIKDCAVIGIPDEKAGEAPLAFVVVCENSVLAEKDVVMFVAEKISKQKHLHGGVRFLSQIPKNSVGKVLRKELLKIYTDSLM